MTRALGRRTVWRGSFFSVEELRVQLPSGRELYREVVRHPGVAGIVPVDAGEVVLIDEFRPALGRSLLQIPAGKLDVPGEQPLACAQRELVEEAGLTASRWTRLATFTVSPGFSDEILHLFLAEGLAPVEGMPRGEEAELIELIRIPLREAHAMISGGRIADGKTIIGILLAREVLS